MVTISVGDKPVFSCELCPTTCGRKTDLRIHVQKLHTSDKLLKCKRCGNVFPDRYSYKVFYIHKIIENSVNRFYLIFNFFLSFIQKHTKVKSVTNVNCVRTHQYRLGI